VGRCHETQFAITGFVGYNFGCMIARGRFSLSRCPMKTADFEVLRDVAMTTILWISI